MPEKKNCDLLITGGTVLPMAGDTPILRNGAIAVSGHTVLAVGSTAEIEAVWTAPTRIDAEGGTVHPGYIDGHTHTGVHCVRGALADDPRQAGTVGPDAFIDWINAITDEDEFAASRLAACEMLMNGYTGVVEAATAFSPDGVAEAVAGVGIRVSVSDCMLWDLEDKPMATKIPRAPCTRERAFGTLGKQLWRNEDPDGLVRAHMGIYGSNSASDELMREAKRIADATGTVVHQHQSMSPTDTNHDAHRFGKPALAHYAEEGLIGPSSVFTHMNVLTEAEADAVAASGMALVWQPGNAVYYGTLPHHPSRFAGLHRRGTDIAFGTDVAKTWSFGDLPFIAYLSTREWGDYLSPMDLLQMLTRGGARAFGMPDLLGALEPGRRADIVIRCSDRPESLPGFDPALELVLVQRTKNVRTVICNGQIVLDDGVPTRVDLAEVAANARQSARETAARAGISLGSA